MRCSRSTYGTLVAVMVAASAANAQEITGTDQPKVTFNEVEHGGYTGAEVGLLFLRSPGIGHGVASGSTVGLSLGYDFSSWIGIGLFAVGFDVVAPQGYGGLGDGAIQGDFSGILPGAEVRLHVPLVKDQNGADRLFFNLGAGGGVMFLQPRALFPSGHAAAGRADAGLEYFTRLRHFSLGLSLEGLGALPRGGQLVGGSLSPFVRYSF
jgi:hypothetical protein